jgi:hypothetical protein
MKRLLNKLWKWRWLLTIPISLIFLYWAGGTTANYRNFVINYKSAIPIHLKDIGENELFKIRNSILDAFSLSSLRKIDKAASLRNINLFIPESNIAKLDSNLPHSGFEYVKGGMSTSDGLQQIKIRYRGDFAYHWGFDKKSFRVKTKKNSLYEGMHKFNLNVPKSYEQINEYLSYYLAKLMGLVVPRTEMVSVSLNGKWQGVYLLLEQLEEMTLRHNRLMPGDLYVGEMIGKDQYKGIKDKGNLFKHPSLWSKAAVNNHFPEDMRSALERLTALVASAADEDSSAALSELLDLEAWGKFSALDRLCQSLHYDNAHNWRLYFDPARSKFVPIIWDPMGFTYPLQPRIITSDLHNALFKNADFLRSRQKALEQFFTSGLDDRLLDEYNRLTKIVKPYILQDSRIMVSGGRSFPGEAEINRYSSIPEWFSWLSHPFHIEDSEQIVYSMEKLGEAIRNNFYQIKNEHLEEPEKVKVAIDNTNKSLQILLPGWQTIKAMVLVFSKPINTQIKGRIAFYKSNRRREVNISDAISINGSRLVISLPLVSNFKLERSKDHKKLDPLYKIVPAYYEYDFDGISEDNQLHEVLVDRGKSGLSAVEYVDTLQPSSFTTLNQIIEPRPPLEPLVWHGEIVIDGVRNIDQQLIIRPGTTIRFKPGASLILKQRLVAVGTDSQPIRFIPENTGQTPWGSVALIGQRANNSRLRHCEFLGGSGLKGDLFEYSGMLSIHDVKNVQIDNCRFSDSNIVDDMVHIVYSEVLFKDCIFERSLMDALDIDISKATIENCRFTDSGNDALDLMDSEVAVVDSLFENSGDKGISVGEGSRLFAVNSSLKGNAIGIQVKDGSVASLNNLDFVSNKRALDAYKKNWRYNDGGEIFVHKSHFKDNLEQITADKNSKIHISDSFFRRLPQLKKKRLQLDLTVDMSDERNAKLAVRNNFPTEAKAIQSINPRYKQRIDPTRRGALNLAQP